MVSWKSMLLGSLSVRAFASLWVFAACLDVAENECWQVDKEKVISGGYVAIILDDQCSTMRGVTVQIDGREPVALMDGAGVTLQYESVDSEKPKKLVIISHDFRSPEAFAMVVEDPPSYRMLPVFHEPGTVTLTLSSAAGPLGSKEIVVLPAPKEAQGALDLLYPTVVRNQGIDVRNHPVLRLLLDSSYGVAPRITREELARLCADVEVLKRHPDWSEMAQMLLARLEARVELGELQDALKKHIGDLDIGEETAIIPETINKALEANLASPAAKAIQSSIKDVLYLRKQLIREYQIKTKNE